MSAHDPCSHLANAHRLVDHFGDQMLFVEGIGWHVWGPPWRHDELAVRRLAQSLGKIIAGLVNVPYVVLGLVTDMRGVGCDLINRLG